MRFWVGKHEKHDNDKRLLPMVEIFDINSIEYENDKRHIGQHCILIFSKKNINSLSGLYVAGLYLHMSVRLEY
jgi:hypothetical protein